MSGIRVLHVAGPSAGGIKKHLLALTGKSHGERYHHMVACPPGALADALAARGIETFAVPLEWGGTPLGALAAATMLAGVIRRSRPRVVHAHGARAGLAGRLAARLAGAPVIVLTVHGSFFQDRWPGWKKRLLATGERCLAGFTGRIITVSEALRREIATLEKISQEKIITIYNGIDPGAFRPSQGRGLPGRAAMIPAAGRVVGTVARLAPQKGLDNFIEAASRVARLADDAVFLVVGDGPLRGDLEKKAGSLGLAGRFIFAGERPDVNSILPCLDVFVLPSLTEGLPLTVLEALAACRPVVASRVGGIPEVITHGVNGLLVDPGDVQGLATAILGLLEDRERADRMGLKGRALVEERFTVGRMVDQTESVYAGLLAGAGIRRREGPI